MVTKRQRARYRDRERLALDLAFAESPPTSDGFGNYSRGRFQMLNSVIGNAITSPDIAVPDIVERVLSLPDRNERSNALRILTERWARNDPQSAFDWLITESNLPDQGFSKLIGSLSRHDPVLAASYTDRVGPGMRNAWIANVAQNYSRVDPQAAVEWLGKFREEPAYAAGAAAVVQEAVDYDPALAADLFATIDDTGRNAQSAADHLARTWARRDQQAARLWMEGLASGPVRDSALRGFVRTAYEESIPDAYLLALFSSEKARQEAVSRTIYSIGTNDPDRARRLLREHISLPEVRSQVEEWLDRQQESRGVTVYRGGLIINN